MGLKPLVPRHVSEIKTLRLWDRRRRRRRRRGNTDTRETSVSADSSDGFNPLAIVNKLFRDVII